MKLTVKTPQLAAAFRIAERSGATEVKLTEMDVGAGRPAWLRMDFVTDGGDRRTLRISKGGNTERMAPPAVALPHTDPDRELWETLNCPLDGTVLTPVEGSEDVEDEGAQLVVCREGHRMTRRGCLEAYRAGRPNDADRDRILDRREEEDWARSAKEQEEPR